MDRFRNAIYVMKHIGGDLQVYAALFDVALNRANATADQQSSRSGG